MRKDYVKKCILSAAFLVSSSFVSDKERAGVLSTVSKMLNEVWKVEHKSYIDNVDERTTNFWNTIHTELETEQHVYHFRAWFGETVNPSGQIGNVELNVQPRNSAEILLFKLKVT